MFPRSFHSKYFYHSKFKNKIKYQTFVNPFKNALKTLDITNLDTHKNSTVLLANFCFVKKKKVKRKF